MPVRTPLPPHTSLLRINNRILKPAKRMNYNRIAADHEVDNDDDDYNDYDNCM